MDLHLSAPSPSSRTSVNNTLVVSHDRALASQLRGMLEEDHRCQVELALSYEEAGAILKLRQPQAVFIDLRKAATQEDPSCLLRDLIQQGQHGVPVIAVSDAGYVCDWAAVADLIVSGHLHLPLDRQQLSHLLESEFAGKLFEASPLQEIARTLALHALDHW